MTARQSVTRSAVSFLPGGQAARPTGSLYPPATLKGIDSDPNADPPLSGTARWARVTWSRAR